MRVWGSTTYEWLLNHQTNENAEHSQAWPYEQPTWVFSSRTLPSIQGADIRFVKGDVRGCLKSLKIYIKPLSKPLPVSGRGFKNLILSFPFPRREGVRG
ncbi:hypothetical protein NIES2101_09160 [Calothrix sp. HK-06]|nr:hypothetical protein NIES2101_09160 [Calothrix sp. HK-06]